MAVASQWVSRVITVVLEMVLPGLIGLWLDRRWNTFLLFTVLGFAAGLTTAIWHLICMTASAEDGKSKDDADKPRNHQR